MILPSNISASKGFTLLELIVVIGIISVSTAIAVPSFLRYYPHMQLKTASMQIFTVLQSARHKAVGSRINYGVRFTLDSDYEADPPVLPTISLVQFNSATDTWEADPSSATEQIRGAAVIDSILIDAETFTSGTTDVIGFTPLGTSTLTRVRMRSGADNNDKFLISVSQATGRVTIASSRTVDGAVW